MHINVKSYNSSELFVERDISSGKYPFIPSLRTSLMFCFGLIAFVLWVTLGTSLASDPYVMKIYPDGTKVVLKWSEVGKTFDNGSTHGGPPKIVAYDPAKDGVVPIGETATPSNPKPLTPQGPSGAYASTPVKPEETNESPNLTGFYVGPEIGGSFQQDVNLKNTSYNTTILGANVVGSAGGSLTMDAGIRFNLPLGYQPVDWFAVEFAPGIIWNKMSSYNLALNGSINGGAQESITIPINVTGSYFQVPLVVNFIFKIPTNSPWVPYLGGGVGASYTYMNWTRISYGGVSEDLSNVDGSCWSLAYQGIAGFDYQIDNEISVGLKYVFTGTGNQNFGGSFQDLSTKGSYSQNVLLNCTLKF